MIVILRVLDFLLKKNKLLRLKQTKMTATKVSDYRKNYGNGALILTWN